MSLGFCVHSQRLWSPRVVSGAAYLALALPTTETGFSGHVCMALQSRLLCDNSSYHVCLPLLACASHDGRIPDRRESVQLAVNVDFDARDTEGHHVFACHVGQLAHNLHLVPKVLRAR